MQSLIYAHGQRQSHLVQRKEGRAHRQHGLHAIRHQSGLRLATLALQAPQVYARASIACAPRGACRRASSFAGNSLSTHTSAAGRSATSARSSSSTAPSSVPAFRCPRAEGGSRSLRCAGAAYMSGCITKVLGRSGRIACHRDSLCLDLTAHILAVHGSNPKPYENT